MIDKQFTKKLLQAIARRNQGLTDHHLMHPEREWFIGLGVAFLCLIGGIIWSVSLYERYSVISPDQNAEVSTPTIYREGEVNQALSELKEREQRSEELKRALESAKTSPFIQKDPAPIVVETPDASSTSELAEEPADTTPDTDTPTSTAPPTLEMAL
jgi:hypothetical protein